MGTNEVVMAREAGASAQSTPWRERFRIPGSIVRGGTDSAGPDARIGSPSLVQAPVLADEITAGRYPRPLPRRARTADHPELPGAGADPGRRHRRGAGADRTARRSGS